MSELSSSVLIISFQLLVAAKRDSYPMLTTGECLHLPLELSLASMLLLRAPCGRCAARPGARRARLSARVVAGPTRGGGGAGPSRRHCAVAIGARPEPAGVGGAPSDWRWPRSIHHHCRCRRGSFAHATAKMTKTLERVSVFAWNKFAVQHLKAPYSCRLPPLAALDKCSRLEWRKSARPLLIVSHDPAAPIAMVAGEFLQFGFPANWQ